MPRHLVLSTTTIATGIATGRVNIDRDWVG